MPRQNEGPYLSDRPNAHGIWEIRWTADGRSKRKSTGQTDRRLAQRALAEAVLASLDGPLTAAGVTCRQVFDAYLEDRIDVDRTIQALTFNTLGAFFGELVIGEIEEADLRRFGVDRAAGRVTFLDAEGRIRGGRKASPGTVRRELIMLRAAINHCIRKKRFKDSSGRPLLTPAHLPDIDLPAAPPPRDRWLSRKEASAWLAACQPADATRLTRDYRYVAVMLHTAARKMSVVKLTWDRIDLEQGLINFRAPGERITKKRRGFVPIGAELRPILERAHRERVSNYLLDKPTAPRRGWETAAKVAGLVDATGRLTVSPHVCRHTWASWAAQDGVPLYVIAGVLHDTVATVQRTYAHHQPEHLRSAVDRPIFGAAA